MRGKSRPLRSARLRLLGGFGLTVNGRDVDVPRSSQRVLAFLAVLRSRRRARQTVAGSLWPSASESRARGDLRSALWRLGANRAIVRNEGNTLALASFVATDLDTFAQILDSVGTKESRWLGHTHALIDAEELLPEWDEEWLVSERTRVNELRLCALEMAAASLFDEGKWILALRAALAAISLDPLREGGRRQLLRILLLQGDRAAAVRHYREYESLVRSELDVQPSLELRMLITPDD